MAISELAHDSNLVDTVCMDVPLFLRMLEYAREEVSTDLQLHILTENILRAHHEGSDVLSMKDYAKLVAHVETSAPIKMSKEHYQKLKSLVEAIGKRKIEDYREALRHDPRVKNLTTRLLFDVFYATKIQNKYSYQEFDYLDSHIASAMKQIFKELHISFV